MPPRENVSPGDDTVNAGFDFDRGEAPSEIGQYTLLRRLGAGGMGTVYEALNRKSGRRVALKLLATQFRSTSESVQRFVQESRIAASINHPRSTFVYEAGEHDGRFFITMELMSGGTLKDVIEKEGAIPVARAVDYVIDMIDGLQAAHSVGIVHRDLKPSNIFIGLDGRVKIGDFGLSKSLVADASLTQTGTFMGTPQFAAPEQLRAIDVDERADIYAVGGTLFYLLTGRPPFEGHAAQVIASIASERPQPVTELSQDIPKELGRIVALVLEKDPARRPANLAALRSLLAPFATRGASLADVGRRMAAFFIDLTIAMSLSQLVYTLLSIPLIAIAKMESSTLLVLPVFNVIVGIFAVVAYFAFAEWKWGASVGKWLLGMRVIDADGGSPGLLATSIRAAMVPGTTWVVAMIPVLLENKFATQTEIVMQDFLEIFVVSQVYGLLSWIPMLLIISVAKSKNGYRGLHGLFTGTRVVRLAGSLQTPRVDNVPVTLPADQANWADPVNSGYRMTGILATGERSSILLAQDSKLERAVWVFTGEDGIGSFSGDRNSVNRVGRLRMVAHGEEDENLRWHATEAIAGSPLSELIERKFSLPWNEIRGVFQGIAHELDLAVDDGTLPASLSVDQFWIDQNGRGRLIDRSMSATDQGNEPVFDDIEPRKRATSAFAHLLEIYFSNHDAPQHAAEFQSVVSDRASQLQSSGKVTPIDSNADDTLQWSTRHLALLADRPSSWRWDDRLGLLAVAAGIEMPLYVSATFFLGLFLLPTFQNQPFQLTAVIIAVGAVIAFVTGWFLRGGIGIRISDVLVVKTKGFQPASRLRCAIRNVLVWVPYVTLMALFINGMHHQLAPPESAASQGLEAQVISGFVMLSSLPIMGLCLLAFVWSLINPSRGIPDMLTFTRIIRK